MRAAAKHISHHLLPWILALSILITGCGPSQPTIPKDFSMKSDGDRASFYLSALDQETDGTWIVIEKVILTGSQGYVAIHPHHGEPWPVIGVSKLLPEGDSKNIQIRLKKALPGRSVVYPMIHVEDNRHAGFNFPPGDPAPKVGGDFVTFPLTLRQ